VRRTSAGVVIRLSRRERPVQPPGSAYSMKESPDSIPLPAKILWSAIIIALGLFLWWMSR
jgi:hypothetical protein